MRLKLYTQTLRYKSLGFDDVIGFVWRTPTPFNLVHLAKLAGHRCLSSQDFKYMRDIANYVNCKYDQLPDLLVIKQVWL